MCDGEQHDDNGDFEQLSPCKMKKHMVPIARFANRIHWRLSLTLLPPGTKVEHFTRNQKMIFIAFFVDQFQ
jgi:hypothetical protein